MPIWLDAKRRLLDRTSPASVDRHKVLVIIPVFDAVRTVADSIRSIIEQTHRNWLLIVVDDASDDGSLAAARAAAADDPRVRIVSQAQNQGTYKAINRGLHEFRDDDWSFFVCQGADDVSDPARIRTQLATAVAAPRVHFLSCRTRRINLDDGSPRKGGSGIGVALISREAFESIGYFADTRFGGDREYVHRIARWQRLEGRRPLIYTTRQVLYTAHLTGKNLIHRYPLKGPERAAFDARSDAKLEAARTVNELFVPY